MMTIIYPNNGQDLILQIIPDESITSFVLTFYTNNTDNGIVKTNSDLKEDNLIKLNSSELAELDKGALKCLVLTRTTDDDFDDNYYNEVQIIPTDFYIK